MKGMRLKYFIGIFVSLLLTACSMSVDLSDITVADFEVIGTPRTCTRLVLVNENVIGYGVQLGENEIFSGTYKLIYLSSDFDAIKLSNYEDGNLDDLAVCYTKEILTADDMYDTNGNGKHIYYAFYENVKIPSSQPIWVIDHKCLTRAYTVQLTYPSSQSTEIGETINGKLTGLPDMINPITNEIQGSALAVAFTAQKASDNGTKAVYEAKIITLPLAADGVQLITNFDHNSHDIQISNATITTK